MSDEVKTQEEIEQKAIKDEWEDEGHVGDYKIGTLRYFTEDNQKLELKIASVKEAIELCGDTLDKKLFYDSDSGNFHFAPDEQSLGEIKIKKINTKLDEIVKLLKEQKYELANWKPSSTIMNRLGNEGNRDEYENYFRKVFSYVRFTALSGAKYDLTGVRFSCNSNNVVSCDIGAIQMMRIPSCNNEASEKFKSVEYYPDTMKVHVDIDQLINDYLNKDYFYYNPKLTIYDNVEDIAKIFIDFINKCEEKYKDK